MMSDKSKLSSFEANFSNSLDAVLSDFQAYETFRKWIMNAKDKSIDALDLWLAVKAYEQYAKNKNSILQKISISIHKKYISPRTGSAWFVPSDIRKQISQRLHSFRRDEMPPADLFEPVKPYTWSYLCDLHALFVCSEEFHEMINDDFPLTSRTIISQQESFDTPQACENFPSTSNELLIPKSTSISGLKAMNQTQHQENLDIANFEVKFRKFRTRPRSEPPVQRTFPVQVPPNFPTYNNDATIERRSKRSQSSKHFIPKEKTFPLNLHRNETLHERPEERQAFYHTLKQKLEMIAEAIRDREEETGQVAYARDIFYDARKFSAWDEEDAPNPELFAAPQVTHPALDSSMHATNTLQKYPTMTYPAQNLIPFESDNIGTEEDENFKPSTSFYVNKTFNPYGRYGFAPPPQDRSTNKYDESSSSFDFCYPTGNYQNTHYPHGGFWAHGKAGSHFSLYGNQFSDSSGFCSSDSAHLNFFNSQGTSKKPGFERSKTMNNGCREYHGDSSNFSKHPQILSAYPSQHHTVHPFATLPRHQKHDREPVKLIVIYKDGGIPYVAKVDPYEMTFKYFRKQFGISSRTNKRFFFKSLCEDGTAPYQWTLIGDDNMILPVFEGKIIAECRDALEYD